MWLKPKPTESIDLSYSPVRTASSCQKYRKEKEPSQWSVLLLDTWLWEILAVSFSILCFLVVICLLRAYEQKALPSFPHDLTLNTIISILSAASKSSMIYAVTASIGQLKWNWYYARKEQLQHIQLFDDASRGPWGSMMMLFSHKGWSLASLGALITLLALAFDPFMQQILRYPIRQAPSPSKVATVKQARSFLIPEIDTSYMKAISTGIWSDEAVFNPSCPSGNCTWTPFRSVGWCSKCEDVTSAATLVGCTDVPVDTNITEPQATPCHVALPQGRRSEVPIMLYPAKGDGSLNPVNTSSVVMELPTDIIWPLTPGWKGKPSANEVYAGIHGPLVVMAYAQLGRPHSTIEVETSPESGLKVDKVTECALTLCERTYNVSVSSGIPSVDVLSVDYGETFNYTANGINNKESVTCWKPSGGNPNLSKYEAYAFSDPNEFSFCPVEDYSISIPSYIKGNTTSPWTWLVQERKWRSPAGDTLSSHAVNKIIYSSLDEVMSNIANAMTKLSLEISETTVNGTVEVSEVYVAVSWAWISLPATVLALGVTFLGLTILATRHQNLSLWKSAILPVLYHGLDDELVDEYKNEQTTVSKMERSAQSVDVKLDVSDSRGKLALRKQS